MASFPYYKGLDGIRGIAVIMVLMIHSRLLPIGWIGVQMFFVLSGFLITGILLTQTHQPFPVFIGKFYWRRALRIWPLYFLFLALCAIVYPFLHVPETLPRVWGWLATFTYNIARIPPGFRGSNYFDHFWTLCVEEQFYLVWPLAVYVLAPRHFRRFVVMVVLAGPLLRYFSSTWVASHFNQEYERRAIVNLPTTNLDAFAWGALVAAVPLELRGRLAPFAGRIFAAVLLITIAAGLTQCWFLWKAGLPAHWLSLGYHDFDYFHQVVWGYTLLDVTTAALILCVLSGSAISRLLSVRPLVFVGVISYGVYLWHLPLLHVFNVLWPVDYHSRAGLVRFAIYCLIVLGVASTSYFGFEKHFLKLKQRAPPKSLERGSEEPREGLHANTPAAGTGLAN